MTSADSFGFSRRGLLGALAVGGAAALAGCQVDTGGSEGGGGSTGDPKEVKFPDYNTKLTDKDATLRWVDSGDLKSLFIKPVLDAFTKKHANIKTNYDGGGWATVNKVVPLGIRNHSAPDVFAKPQDVPNATLVNEKWVQPLDDIIPDFDKWKSNFPDTAFIPGLHVFDGKTYSWPQSSDRRLGNMCIYDKKNLAKAGYDDPGSQIKTWDDFHTALSKVVKNGNVGLMVGFEAMQGLINIFAMSQGWLGAGADGMNYKTGEFVRNADEIMTAYEFVAKLIKDKLVVPGFLTLKQADARAQMPAGKSAVVISGPWDIPRWKKNSPNWEYLMETVPSENGDPYLEHFVENGANNEWVYKDSKLSNAAGQIVGYMGSPEGQKMMVILSQGNLTSMQEGINEEANRSGLLDKNAVRAADLAKKMLRATPNVPIRNPDVSKVDLVHKQVQPTWKILWEGVFSGKTKDVKKALDDYVGKQEQALETAIKTAAKDKGSSIVRDDYKFPNWDPTKDYALADYKQLPNYKGPK